MISQLLEYYSRRLPIFLLDTSAIRYSNGISLTKKIALGLTADEDSYIKEALNDIAKSIERVREVCALSDNGKVIVTKSVIEENYSFRRDLLGPKTLVEKQFNSANFIPLKKSIGMALETYLSELDIFFNKFSRHDPTYHDFVYDQIPKVFPNEPIYKSIKIKADNALKKIEEKKINPREIIKNTDSEIAALAYHLTDYQNRSCIITNDTDILGIVSKLTSPNSRIWHDNLNGGRMSSFMNYDNKKVVQVYRPDYKNNYK